MRRLLGVAVAGQILRTTDAGVVQGASNLEVRLGTLATRPSSDLDTVRRHTIQEFTDTIAAALRIGWEGFTGEVTAPKVIAAPVPADYQPHRMRVKLRSEGGNFATLTVEVSPDEVDGLARVERVVSVDAEEWFVELGLPAPDPIPMLSLAHQVAQKLHACTAPDAPEWTNDRVHDLVDLPLAMDGFAGDHADITHAATRLFAARGRHPWPPRVTARAGWEEGYRNEAAGLAPRPVP